tara:strand:- start:119 stop:427 length:309 start_codon:yes stop_codon:yes gene_type:complete
MKLNHLKKEHSLNKILRKQRSQNGEIKILFVSLWDSFSTELLDKLSEAPDKEEELYVVDSYNMPHSFVIFNTTKLPHLVSLKGRKIRSEDYLSRIYKELELV